MNFDFNSLLAIIGPILAVIAVAAIVKKAIGIAITLIAILIIAYMVMNGLGVAG